MKVSLMKSPNRVRTPIGHLFSPNKASSFRTGLHLTELLAKKVLWNSPNNPGYCQDTGCTPQIDSKPPMLTRTPTQLTEKGKIELLPTQNLHPHVLVSLTWKGTLWTSQGKHKHQPNHKPFIYNRFCLQTMLGQNPLRVIK